MPLPEYFYRAKQSAALKKRAAVAGRTPALRFFSTLAELPEITEPRQVRFFDVVLLYDGTEEIDWHRDYSTGKRSPRRFYGRIDYRDSARIGDAKYIWELNRHQFMVPWALHYAATGDEQDVAAIVHLLLNWIAANPRYVGINWASSLELALRLLSWGIVFDLCRHSTVLNSIRPMVERSVTEQAGYIHDTLSLYSSANNHLVGELVGLVAAGVFFPNAPSVRQYAEFARAELLRQAHLQNHADGVNREQAVYYHYYTLEYLTTAMALFERAGWNFPDETAALVRKMLEFIDAVVDDEGVAPEIGDRDDGSVTGLNLGTNVGLYESLLWTGWRLFGEQSFADHAAGVARGRGDEPSVDPRTVYWHGLPENDSMERWAESEPAATATARIFQQGGYAVFGLPATESVDALRILFRAGPFGYPRIAAHSHCDQLSLCAKLGEMELLTDSGTYCYHSNERWRRYFKGTTAHNTVRVDEMDQAEYGGPFLWVTHADAELQELQKREFGFRIAGVHSGYRRLAEPVEHSRTIEVSSGERKLLVRDTLGSGEAHKYELIWNFGPGIEPEWSIDEEQMPNTEITYRRAEWLLRTGQNMVARFSVNSEHPFQVQLFHGDEVEPAGWYSRKFGERVPIYQLRITVTAGWWSVDSALTIH
ncbi:MAG: alginate lyase family protein [Candidatus Sumerlaeaceae bacterium]